jgi:transcriptional regulator with XRE-family HTH domain
MEGSKMNRVKALRKMKNLRQIEVAEGADVAISTLWMIEKGFVKKTTHETKKKLADFFEVDIEELFPVQGQKK